LANRIRAATPHPCRPKVPNRGEPRSRSARVGIIHRLTYRRHNHDNIHVRGYKEKGTTTTPFDMVVLNNLDRYQLTFDAIRRIPRLADQVQKASDRYWTMMERHKLYFGEHGDDMPEVRDWRWSL
jgi:xylulose-5-phosphate/fructose-6-phosphate phosphoketolase